jgi:hypothetical protein
MLDSPERQLIGELIEITDATGGELREANARLSAAGNFKTRRQIDPPDGLDVTIAGMVLRTLVCASSSKCP